MAFSAIKRIAKNLSSLTIDQIAAPVWDNRAVQSQIVDQITEVQLYEKGEDADGRPLGDYSPFTIRYKTEVAGSLGNDTRTDHITLKDTGDFYRSFRVQPEPGGFIVTADAEKENGDDLAEMYGKEILGLSNESIAELVPQIAETAVPHVRAAILK